MLHNNIDNNKCAEKAATLLNSAPILKVCASGNACHVSIFGWVIKFDCSALSPTSSTQQSNSNDVGNGNSNEVGDNKEGNEEGSYGNGDGNKGGGQATVTT
jgi:hypothetical protein